MSLLRQIKNAYLLAGIFLVYFLLRLPNLTLQPIFADEAIYIRWAQIANSVPSLRFISLQDGKTPLFMWAMAPFLTIFSDPLFAGRFLSIISGFFTILGVYFLGKKFFNQKVGLFGAFLVATTPFLIFFDRMALVDSMLGAFTIWSVFFALKLVEKPNIKNSIVLGVLLGGGWLTKTPGLINIALLPILLILVDFKKVNLKTRLIKLGGLGLLSSIIAVALYLIQRIDPNFHQLSARNSDYVHPLSRLLIYPFDPLGVHFLDTVNFSLFYLGPLIILIPLLVIFTIWQKNRLAIVLLLWALVPIIYELQFIKAYTGRYILFSIPIILLLLSWMISFLWTVKKLKFVVLLFLSLNLLWTIYFSYNLLINPINTPLGNGEKRGYFADWTAGYGLKEIASFLAGQANMGQIIVGTEGSFGTLPDGLWIYLDAQKNIAFKVDKFFMPDNLRLEAQKNPTFFVANRPLDLSATMSGILLKQFIKPAISDTPIYAISLYKVLPSDK